MHGFSGLSRGTRIGAQYRSTEAVYRRSVKEVVIGRPGNWLRQKAEREHHIPSGNIRAVVVAIHGDLVLDPCHDWESHATSEAVPVVVVGGKEAERRHCGASINAQ